jgi:hypothetical protein
MHRVEPVGEFKQPVPQLVLVHGHHPTAEHDCFPGHQDSVQVLDGRPVEQHVEHRHRVKPPWREEQAAGPQ